MEQEVVGSRPTSHPKVMKNAPDSGAFVVLIVAAYLNAFAPHPNSQSHPQRQFKPRRRDGHHADMGCLAFCRDGHRGRYVGLDFLRIAGFYEAKYLKYTYLRCVSRRDNRLTGWRRLRQRL